jgi:hypothetical protein
MKLQYAPFLLPLHSDSAEQEELNGFLRAHRIPSLALVSRAAAW